MAPPLLPMRELEIRHLTLRVDEAEKDQLAAKIEVQRALSDLATSFPGLAPSAILCIRSLPDPHPGRLRLRATQAQANGEWRDTFAQALAGRLQRAVRPALSTVPCEADAVFFADYAELLACLARDTTRGELTHWWWRSLVPGLLRSPGSRPPSGILPVVSMLADAPEAIPSVFDCLDRDGVLIRFVQRLALSDAANLLLRMLKRFGLDDATRITSSLLEGEVATGRNSRFRSEEDGPAKVTQAEMHRSPPWRPYWSEPVENDLSPERRALVGVALSIQRAPGVARSSRFSTQLANYLSSFEEPVATETDEVEHPLPAPPTSEPPPETGAKITTRIRTFEARSVADTAAPSPALAAADTAQDRTPVSVEGYTPSPHKKDEEPSDSVAAHSEPAAASAAEESPGNSISIEPPRPVNVRGVHADWSEPVVTRFGGAFYLVNVALALGLYPDFTRPASLGLWLPLWSYLRQVSARLLAEEPPDAIWSLLSDLTPFGGSLTEHEEPRDWFVEPDWLRGFTPPKEWLATQSSSRLRILHPAGFAAIDARADLDPALIAAKLSEYGTGPLRFAEAEPRTSAQWIDWHVEYLRARLRLALRVDDSQIGPLLLEHRARVHVTATRIDVVFSLEELPIAIRLAGLDRDPGFLPTEARSLHFHFV